MDKELWDNNWIIEYDPLSGSIYSVFYSEQPITGENLANYLQNMRVKQARLNDGARIGYYGGDVTLTYSTNNLEPRIVIENKEKLTATFYCTRPSAYALTFQITVKDGFGKTYTRTVNHDQLTQINSRTFTYTWVMDSLENAKSGFVAQTGLAGGTDIDVTLTVFSEDPMVDKASCTETDNSLFAYRKGTSADTALIAFARHLQNLDKPTSQVSDTVTKAIQITDISFQDDPTDDEDWVSVYKKDTFIPIRNDALTAYNGKSTLGEAEVQSSIYNLHVEAGNRNAGLFDHFTGTLSNIYLTGTKIDGGNYVGGLAGRVTNTTIDNCRVYLSQRKGDPDRRGRRQQPREGPAMAPGQHRGRFGGPHRGQYGDYRLSGLHCGAGNDPFRRSGGHCCGQFEHQRLLCGRLPALSRYRRPGERHGNRGQGGLEQFLCRRLPGGGANGRRTGGRTHGNGEKRLFRLRIHHAGGREALFHRRFRRYHPCKSLLSIQHGYHPE